MRVLLTRAEEDARRSAARLARAGHSTVVSPLIRIVDMPCDPPAQSFDVLAMTSAHAAASGGAARLVATRGATRLWVVGQRTLEAARRAGFHGPAMVASDAEALVVEAANAAARPAHVLYLAGADRKPTLEAGLAALGIAVTPIEVYAARAAESLNGEALTALREGVVDAVLHYSRRSAALFVAAAEQAGIAPIALRHACLSEDAAAPLRDAGATRIAVAAAPREDALIAALALLARAEDGSKAPV